MKKRLLVLPLVIMFISTSFIVPTTIAQSSGLIWGVESGEEFTYVLQRKTMEPLTLGLIPDKMPFVILLDEGQKFFAKVNKLDLIPDNYSLVETGYSSHCTLSRMNDSEIIFSDSLVFVLPIGDWDYQTQRLNISEYSDITLIDNNNEWGYVQSGTYNTLNYYFELRYEKENGTLNYVRFRYETQGTVIMDVIFVQWYEGVPTILPPDLQLTTIMMIALAVSIGVIVAFCVFKSIRNKKPLVQRLGE